MRELSVCVGRALDAEQLQAVLAARSGALLNEVAHALLEEHNDDRAVVTSVEVKKVMIDPVYSTQVFIEFETSWSIYKGCEDKNLSDCEPESESATYTDDGQLIFVVPSPRKHAEPC